MYIFFFFSSRRRHTRYWRDWSSDVCSSDLIVVDARGGRVLERGRRSMVDADEWRWIEEHATGGFDHLLLGTSLPVLLGPGVHHLQAWNEAVCSGAWGERATKRSEERRVGKECRSRWSP